MIIVNWIMAATTILYLTASVLYGVNHNYPQTVMLFCYAIANAAIMWSAW